MDRWLLIQYNNKKKKNEARRECSEGFILHKEKRKSREIFGKRGLECETVVSRLIMRGRRGATDGWQSVTYWERGWISRQSNRNETRSLLMEKYLYSISYYILFLPKVAWLQWHKSVLNYTNTFSFSLQSGTCKGTAVTYAELRTMLCTHKPNNKNRCRKIYTNVNDDGWAIWGKKHLPIFPLHPSAIVTARNPMYTRPREWPMGHAWPNNTGARHSRSQIERDVSVWMHQQQRAAEDSGLFFANKDEKRNVMEEEEEENNLHLRINVKIK